MNPLTVAVIVVSDTCAKDHSQDKVIATVEQILANSSDFKLTHTAYVPDDSQELVDEVRSLAYNDKINLIITCGGTGFTLKDKTPERIGPLIERQASGLVHGILATSLAITPFAMMARPVAGTVAKSVVVTLPGSPKAVTECLDALLPLLPHACEQTAGDNARTLHRKMLKDKQNESSPGTSHSHSQSHSHSHSHGHSHHSHSHGTSHSHSHGTSHSHSHGPLARHDLIDSSSAPARRKRESPFPMLPMEDALKIIFETTPKSSALKLRISDPAIIGKYSAESITAPIPVPPYSASIVDGYAVVSSDGPGSYPVVSSSLAGFGSDMPSLVSGTIARITTGAPVPPGADSVVMVEETVCEETTEDGNEERVVKILAKDVKPNENIRFPGSDIAKGDTILEVGQQIDSAAIAVLASVGIAEIFVYSSPSVAVFSTGNELSDVFSEGDPTTSVAGVYDANRPYLLSAVRRWGCEPVDLGIIPDDSESLISRIKDALESHDIIITTGGVSMGEKDLLKPTLEKLGATIHFGRIAMKPGKPTTYATLSLNGKQKQIFALPGNPASAAVTFHLFILPALRVRSGIIAQSYKAAGLPIVKVKLESDIKLDFRPEYQRAIVQYNSSSNCLMARTTGFQRSSRISSMVASNALLCLPSSDSVARGTVKAGSLVDAMLTDVLYTS
ncbi:hypothetical protein CANCADRAFT_137015 [Tortispora caseinolytica NRRL Y-17796]|uniref:molybdopterin adenylyltransferase n=1 Tax=Tortispora caseinolytica NRRL Y-17796 TaxID=767744 RepID=A0A1E4TC22_9ASCO|nr:hypothetical protein CANCADRAFT_137015 [Tortispora caseinolytica NRRL Y-17796]